MPQVTLVNQFTKFSLTTNSLNMFKHKIVKNINLYWVDPCPGFLGLVDFTQFFFCSGISLCVISNTYRLIQKINLYWTKVHAIGFVGFYFIFFYVSLAYLK